MAAKLLIVCQRFATLPFRLHQYRRNEWSNERPVAGNQTFTDAIQELGICVLTRGLCLAAVWALPLIGSALAAEERPAIYSSEELRQTLDQFHKRIRAWHFVYESAPMYAEGGPPGGYIRHTVAAKHPDSFFSWTSHGTDMFDRQDDPAQQRDYVTSQQHVVEDLFDRVYRKSALAPEAQLPSAVRSQFLFAALGWWPFESRPAPKMFGDLPSVIPDIVESPHYVVAPLQELHDGRWCHVLEFPGRDRLWLDCERNCTLMGREIFDKRSGAVLDRIESREHREAEPGIWIPREIRRTFVDTGKRRHALSPRNSLETVFTILEVRLNADVRSDIFEFRPLAGSIQIFDEDARFLQTEPGGTEHLEHVFQWIRRRYGRIPKRARSATSTVSRDAIVDYAVILAAAFLVAAMRWGRLTAVLRHIRQ